MATNPRHNPGTLVVAGRILPRIDGTSPTPYS